MMAKKSYNEKLHDSKNMPEISEVTDPNAALRYGGTRMLIAPPLAYDGIMKKGPVRESDHVR